MNFYNIFVSQDYNILLNGELQLWQGIERHKNKCREHNVNFISIVLKKDLK